MAARYFFSVLLEVAEDVAAASLPCAGEGEFQQRVGFELQLDAIGDLVGGQLGQRPRPPDAELAAPYVEASECAAQVVRRDAEDGSHVGLISPCCLGQGSQPEILAS